MAKQKHLIIGKGSIGRWRLPSDYDVESLRTDLEEAFSKGTFPRGSRSSSMTVVAAS